MIQGRVKLSDVAKHVGVTAATVSYVLTNKKNISIRQETRKKVLKAASDLGYQQNHIARSLRANKSYMMGVLIPKLIGSYLLETLAGAEEILFENDYLCSLLDIEQEKECNYAIELCQQKRFDGLFVMGPLAKEYVEKVLKENIPVVQLSWVSKDKRLTSVTGDDIRCGELAAGHLVSSGCERIRYFTGSNDSNIANKRRIKGIKDVLIARGATQTIDDLVLECGWNSEEGYQATKKLILKNQCPSGIICYSDSIAYGVLRALAEYKVKVPEEVSVVGIDNTSFSEFTYPPLTSVRWPRIEIGRIGAQTLLDMVGKSYSSFTPRQVILKPELIMRKSTTL